MKITIMGTGAYSLGIAKLLSKDKNKEIMLWTENEDTLKEFRETHQVKRIFEDVVFDDNIKITGSFEEAMQNTNLIFMIPAAKYIKSTAENIKPYYHNTPICIASKGIDEATLSPLSVLVKNILHTNNICVISGPTFAIDLIHEEPAALAIAGYNKKCTNFIKSTLENDTLKLRVSSDIIGIQLCGSIKNIIAIAAGILKGLGYSESTQAFLINESLHDMKNIIYALGGKRKTILSFAGIGDLLLTCSSPKSRNYSFGYVIGSTKNKKEIDKYLKENTVEGYYTLNSIYLMLNKKGVSIPLITLIYNIVCEGMNPSMLASFLISKK